MNLEEIAKAILSEEENPPVLRGLLQPGETANIQIAGVQGEKGDKGDRGEQGTPGFDGVEGPVGPVGKQGDQGLPGTDGDPGPKGDRGLRGEKGPKGDKGDAGRNGTDGATGPQGLRGSPGPRGPQGLGGGGGGGSGSGSALSNATPLIEAGLGASGSGTLGSRDDHVHPAAAGSGTPSATVESETTYGISPAAGASNDYSRGDHTHGSPATPTAASVGAAPSTVDYLVGTASAGLSAEIVVGTTPGGELGNTWASPTVDTTHSGSSHAGVVSAHEAAANPHPGYLTQAEGDAAYDVIGAAAAVAANAVNDGDAAGGDLSGTYPNPSVVNDSHSHTAATLPASTLGFVSQARWFTD